MRSRKKIRNRWLQEHKLLLLYLPAYSPKMNLIEIIWKQAKYHWRRFNNWTQDTMENELNTLLKIIAINLQLVFLKHLINTLSMF
ncbi:transposase [Xenorhabdus stockiae]